MAGNETEARTDGNSGKDTVVGLGSNLGDRVATLRGAVKALSGIGPVQAVSPLYETDAVGAPGPAYLNAAIRLTWPGSPGALLARLLSIERGFGRVRRERWGPRTLDLDVLWIAETSFASPDLVVPHPRLLERRFALEPLLDVAPHAVHPVTRVALSTCLGALPRVGIARIAAGSWATGEGGPL